MKEEILAWHFLRDDCLLGYKDKRKVEIGKKITVDCKPVLCESGLHGSVRAIDALRYAPGPMVCRVVLSGEFAKGNDKIAATERTVIAMADATALLHTFACDIAEEAVLKYCNPPDPRSLSAIQTKRDWLTGKATDAQLAAARGAVSAAARDAVSAAARDAAWAAARDAQNELLEALFFKLLNINPKYNGE